MIRIGRKSAFLRGLRCSWGKETSQSTGFMRHKADGIFEGCLVWHVKKHDVESVNHISQIDCLEGVMFEVKCLILLQANVFLFLPYVPTAVLLAGDLFFFGQMDLGPFAVGHHGHPNTSQRSYGHHEHFGIFWRRTYGSTSEACESRVTLEPQPLDLGRLDSRIRKLLTHAGSSCQGQHSQRDLHFNTMAVFLSCSCVGLQYSYILAH